MQSFSTKSLDITAKFRASRRYVNNRFVDNMMINC
jgi:hypothetical protein